MDLIDETLGRVKRKMQQVNLQNSATDRIYFLMELYGFRSEQAMADAVGIPRSTLRSILERNAVGRKTAEKIATCFNISAAWVERGYGDPPMSDSGAYSVESDIAHGQPPVIGEAPLIAPPLLHGDPREFVFLRKARAKLSAGGGLMPEEGYMSERYAFRVDWLKRIATSVNNVVLVDVVGDSMEPTLLDGDAVLIDIGRREFYPGKLFAIGVGDIIQVKRLSMIRVGTIRIISDSQLYGVDEIPAEELRIIGQLIWSARTWT